MTDAKIEKKKEEIAKLTELLDFEVSQRDEYLQKYVITDWNEEWEDEESKECQLQNICDLNAFIVPLRERLKDAQLVLEWMYENMEKDAA